MSQIIDKKTLEHLAELARIEINKEQEEKLLKDMRNILAYIKELEDLGTDNVEPLDGGTENKNVFNPDDESVKKIEFNKEKTMGSFPKNEGNFLKIPPVFENNE